MVLRLEGWQIYQTNDLLKVRDAGVVGISQVPDTSAGIEYVLEQFLRS